MASAQSESFIVEQGEPGAKVTGVQISLLQEIEKDIIYFKEHFLGKDQVHLFAEDSPVGPVCVSLIITDTEYKAIFRTDKGSERLSCPIANVPKAFWRRLIGTAPSLASILRALSPAIPNQSLVPSNDRNAASELLAMEERQVIRSYKFGLLYARSGQTTETEMFNNQGAGSAEYRNFLTFLGETIDLKGWKGYRGGLDVVNGLTGEQSVYTKWQNYEIMYHVSTMLPYNRHEAIQLERKRHIGNDILIMIFQDSDTPIKLDSIDSKQNHVFALITPHSQGYRLRMVRKNGVPAFAPDLPEPCILKHDAVSRDFFLHKLINGERAAYKAPSFAPKISRTRAVLLKDIAQRF